MASSPPDDGWSILPDGWTWSDVGHGALDVGGLVPGFGEGADLANAAWYAAEGNYLDAGLSIISMVPIVGDIIGKGGKLAKKAGGKLAGPALDALKKMDFKKMLEPLAKHPKIGPHVDKIAEALEKWRKDLVGEAPSPKANGLQPCPQATKIAGERAVMIGKSAVPIRILKNLSPAERAFFEKALLKAESVPAPRADRAVFYSGKSNGRWSYEVVGDLEKSGVVDSVNSLSGDLLNADDIRKILPRDAMAFIDNTASKRLAETAIGKIKFVGELDSIGPDSVFRKTELPALLKNKALDPASRSELRFIRQFLDTKYGG